MLLPSVTRVTQFTQQLYHLMPVHAQYAELLKQLLYYALIL